MFNVVHLRQNPQLNCFMCCGCLVLTIYWRAALSCCLGKGWHCMSKLKCVTILVVHATQNPGRPVMLRVPAPGRAICVRARCSCDRLLLVGTVQRKVLDDQFCRGYLLQGGFDPSEQVAAVTYFCLCGLCSANSGWTIRAVGTCSRAGSTPLNKLQL